MPVTITSKNNIEIRLTDERWAHIIQEHGELSFFQPEVISTISSPDLIVAGNQDERIAIREIDDSKWMVVIYSEGDQDGFVITAFMTRRRSWWRRRKRLWP